MVGYSKDKIAKTPFDIRDFPSESPGMLDPDAKVRGSTQSRFPPSFGGEF
jgi:hypothetical protein